MKRVIAVLDLPPRRSLPNVRASFHATATRWNAEVLWITNPLHPCHPFSYQYFAAYLNADDNVPQKIKTALHKAAEIALWLQ